FAKKPASLFAKIPTLLIAKKPTLLFPVYTQNIKRYYHDAIVTLTKDIIDNIDDKNFKPNLYSVLFDFHRIKKEEKVICVLTLNYEDLFEQTLKSHLNIDVDYLIDKKRIKKKYIPVLKLHGSFNWVNTRPVKIRKTKKLKSADALWIPPGIEKKKDNYPFNILWGKAFDFLMECEILRVIGCSLNRNDWGLIPLIYTSLRLSKKIQPFEIEIIDFVDIGEKIKNDYPYLTIKTLIEIPEIYNYLIDVYNLKSAILPKYVKDDLLSDASKKLNIFELWLKAKRFDLQNTYRSLRTKNKFLENFS
ncbi:MAG: hypothetical protein JXC36_08965, partial [Candidatus Atribacteria bacterium]|nr:hypothetical protein [Candidatus Atribacteria bacterium]